MGPNRRAGQVDPTLLRAAFDNSLRLAKELGCASVALPAVSAGAFGWSIHDVAQAAVAAARSVRDAPGSLRLIRFVLISERPLAAFQRQLNLP